MDRRRYLGVVAAGVIAGCSGDDSDDGSESGDEDGREENGDEEETERADGDDEANGDEETATAEFDQQWTVSLEATDFQQRNYDSSAADGALFVGSSAGLDAFELADGTRRWHRDDWTAYRAVDATLDGVVALTRDLEVVGLDTATGDTGWERSVDGNADVGYPWASTSNSLVVSLDGETVSYNRETGEVAGRVDEAGGGLIAGGGTAVVTRPTESVAFDPATGAESWRTELAMEDEGVVVENRIVFPQPRFDRPDLIRAVDRSTGGLLWETETDPLSAVTSAVAATDGVVTFMGDAVEDALPLYGLDVGTGEELWRTGLGDVISPFAPPATTDGVIVAQTENDIGAFGAQTGAMLDTAPGALVVFESIGTDGLFVLLEGQDITAYNLT